MRQYTKGALPDELLEPPGSTARASSASYLTVGLPLLRPGLAFLGIFTFISAWNDYIWPLIVLTDPNQSPCRSRWPSSTGIARHRLLRW